MNDDKTVLAPIEVPGMQINFQSPVGAQGKVFQFICSAEADITGDDLNRRLDVITSAVRRQDAFEQLRYDQQAVRQKTKELPKERDKLSALKRDRDRMIATISAKASVAVPDRRNRVQAVPTSPVDISSLASIDRDIADKTRDIAAMEDLIAGCEERIPFWRAILRGEEPLDLGEPPRMAAE
jgi:hypothetical protein